MIIQWLSGPAFADAGSFKKQRKYKITYPGFVELV